MRFPNLRLRTYFLAAIGVLAIFNGCSASTNSDPDTADPWVLFTIAANSMLHEGAVPFLGKITDDKPDKRAKFASDSDMDIESVYTAIINLGVIALSVDFMAKVNDRTYTTASDGLVPAEDMTPPTPAYMAAAVSDMELAYSDAAGRATPDLPKQTTENIAELALVPGPYK